MGYITKSTSKNNFFFIKIVESRLQPWSYIPAVTVREKQIVRHKNFDYSMALCLLAMLCWAESRIVCPLFSAAWLEVAVCQNSKPFYEFFMLSG